MFDETLLESSPSRASVLRAGHWWISAAVGLAGFLIAYFFFQYITGAETKVLVTQGVIVGALFFFYALMICYVYADTRHLGLSPWLWIALVVLFNLAGFVLYLIYSASKADDWKRATIPIAYIFEGVVLGIVILIPLLHTPELGMAQLTTFLQAPPPPPPPPPPAAAPPKIVVHQVSMAELMKAPTVIPKTIQIIKDQPKPAAGTVGVVGGVPGGVPGGQMGGVLGGVIGGMLGSAPPPPPPKAATPTRIRVGGQVEEARIIYKPIPEYPPLAKMARIQGTVRLEAIISKDGTIQDLKVISGHPLLVPAALAAVRTWRYQPTLLNGEPVEVVTEIDVNFTLSE